MRCWWARVCVKKKMMEGRGGRDNMDNKMKNIEYSSGGILYVCIRQLAINLGLFI